MFGYICLYLHSDEKFEVRTNEGIYAAKLQALEHFRAKHPRRKIKPHEVTAYLAEKAGEPVTHTADF
jgi:hypothetical protein